MWILSIEIKQNNTLNGQYTILYHSPSSSVSNFINYFNEWIDKYHNEEKKHIVCGDFNIDMAETSNKKSIKYRLNRIIQENGMIQVMNEYTRITENTKKH